MVSKECGDEFGEDDGDGGWEDGGVVVVGIYGLVGATEVGFSNGRWV